jgi:dTDP-4-dehydrorhamnose 3,5-epimerase
MEYFKILDLTKHTDNRGVFARTYDQTWLTFNAIQSNISFNPAQSTLRGLHFQASGPPENKLVTLISGSVYLVVVDLRKSSPDFLKPKTVELNSPLSQSLYIPSGYATGWISTSSNTTLQYLMSARYEECTYSGIRFNDPALDIEWPCEPEVISEVDTKWPDLELYD